MDTIVFTESQEEIIQPKGGLVVELPQVDDHVLGATGPEFAVLQENGQWHEFLPDPELQRNDNGDTFMCVTFSLNNAHEAVLKRLYGEAPNFSDLCLGVASGTVRGRGNTKRAVADTKRLEGCCLEGEYPYLKTTTLDQAYAPLPDDVRKKAKRQLDFFQFAYKWVSDNSAQSLKQGLKYSPLQVDVLGSYKVGPKGYIVFDVNNPTYNHEVIVVGYEEGACWHVFDSESQQLLKFDWWYPFGSPMVHGASKTSKVEILKEKGKPALAVKHVSQPALIAFSGGPVVGEDLFKSLYGIQSFVQLPIKEVDRFPFPVEYLLNTVKA